MQSVVRQSFMDLPSVIPLRRVRKCTLFWGHRCDYIGGLFGQVVCDKFQQKQQILKSNNLTGLICLDNFTRKAEAF
jgi:hypothetical protein